MNLHMQNKYVCSSSWQFGSTMSVLEITRRSYLKVGMYFDIEATIYTSGPIIPAKMADVESRSFRRGGVASWPKETIRKIKGGYISA
jgi:hypothetical protein